MADPRFSESQLQSAVNGALIRYTFEHYKTWVLPHVVSLFDEFTAGWDSALVVPWYPPGDPNQEGCNLFIQYKLSEKLVSTGASQWKYWSSPYYRFQIPHRTLDKNDKYVNDYHQWKSLRKIAKAGYATFYATNNTLSKRVLKKDHDAGNLLDKIRWLDVNDVKTRHRYVTFTESSSFFYLHSEPEAVELTSIKDELPRFPEKYEQQPLWVANSRLISQLSELAGSNENYRSELSRIQQLSSELSNREYAHYVHALLGSFVHRRFGSILVWVPRLVG